MVTVLDVGNDQNAAARIIGGGLQRGLRDLLNVRMVGVVATLSSQAARQTVEHIAHIVTPALVEGIRTVDAGLQPVDSLSQPANQRAAPAGGGCFGITCSPPMGTTTISVCRQRQQSISVFGGGE